MDAAMIPGPGNNRLLQILARADLDELRPQLERVALQKGEICIRENKPIEYVYFLESGLSSCVVPDERKGKSEVGMQGYEGLVGVPVLLGADRGPHRVFMQAGGTGLRISSSAIMEVMDRSPPVRRLLLRYAQVFFVQTAQTAYTNARFDLVERLSRWLLMESDRLGPQLELTHEYLAYMLGSRRSGVTEGLHILEGKHLIRNRRGLIVIRDPDGLRALAGASYGVPEAEYRRLIGLLL